MTVASDLGEFKEALAGALTGAGALPGIPATAVDQIIAGLRTAPHGGGEPGGADAEAASLLVGELETAFENAHGADTDGAKAAPLESLRRLAPALPWYRRACPERPRFEAGHANAEIIGAGGIERRPDLTVGVTLMIPELTYPDHHHPPEEVYLVLSPGAWRQDARPWHQPGFGGYVYNPPDILHAMQSEAAPLLAIWCLNPVASEPAHL